MILEIPRSGDNDKVAVISKLASPGPAKLKVVDPIATMGPSSHAEIVSASSYALRIRTARRIMLGSKVQVRTVSRIMFGEVLSAAEHDGKFDIIVEIQS
jgi:hypothetical protein